MGSLPGVAGGKAGLRAWMLTGARILWWESVEILFCFNFSVKYETRPLSESMGEELFEVRGEGGCEVVILES
jgi:hypothetical protein